MRFKVQLIKELETGELSTVAEIALAQKGDCCLENLGLKLAEAKDILAAVQKALVVEQISDFIQEHRKCPDCQNIRTLKDAYPVVFRSLFGNIPLASQRLNHCKCSTKPTKTFSPLATLLSSNTAPELVYLETKWASMVSFAKVPALLKDVLPVANSTNPATVRNNTHKVGRRLESELGEEQLMFATGSPREIARLPHPAGPITVGIDGTYVRDWTNKKEQFEVIVGKSIPENGASKCFGFVQTLDEKPKRRLFEVLNGQGMQMKQQVIFLSDGGENVRDLQLYMNPQAEHVLDWFHITMRLTVLKNCAQGIAGLNKALGEEALGLIEKVKWYLWHGNTHSALSYIEDLVICVDPDNEDDYGKPLWRGEQKARLATIEGYVSDLETYIDRNSKFIVNYGERYRAGERISTGFTESAVNYIVNKRFSKRQQMQWSKSGAHLLLQTRIKVLNDELEATFERWYPGSQAA